MKTQKQSRVDALEKKQAAMTKVLQDLINEFNNVRTMSVGLYSLVKEMSDYDTALEKLKTKEKQKDNVE